MKITTYLFGIIVLISIFTADAATQIEANSQTVVAPTKTLKSLSATGSVISVDIVGNTLSVEGKKKSQWIFSVPANAKILEGKKTIALGDILIGFKVVVKYNKEGDTLSASSIKVWPVKKIASKVGTQ